MRRLVVLLLPAACLIGTAAAASDVADAAMKGNREAVRSLLEKKANVNAPQTDGTTALHWAVRTDDMETTALLIKAGARMFRRRIATAPRPCCWPA